MKDFVEQNLALYARGETEAFRERMLSQTRLSAIDRRDHERMRLLVRAMARRLATQYGRNRKRDRRGVLDVRRTLRRNMGWDGIPFLTIWKQERIQKPKLVVLCDVSGSVAAIAQFLLLFLYSLNEALADLHAFAFSGNLVDVSEILERNPIETAIPEVMARAGFGSSNYGMALVDFERAHMRPAGQPHHGHRARRRPRQPDRSARRYPDPHGRPGEADRLAEPGSTARCGALAIPTCCATRRIAG